eukprot:m.55654 g.55654  ORF g.55654 m.55654 type:complete len:62 (-) comp48896_c0_seq1:21-206(-)
MISFASSLQATTCFIYFRVMIRKCARRNGGGSCVVDGCFFVKLLNRFDSLFVRLGGQFEDV